MKSYYGTKGESGEHSPKGASASDTRVERRTSVPRRDSEKGTAGASGEHEPAGTKASDASGERHSKIEGGVGMGKADALTGRKAGHAGAHDGRTGEFNTGKHEGHIYSHQRHKLGFTHKGG